MLIVFTHEVASIFVIQWKYCATVHDAIVDFQILPNPRGANLLRLVFADAAKDSPARLAHAEDTDELT